LLSFISIEILPSIRKTGEFSLVKKEDNSLVKKSKAEELLEYAQLMVEHEKSLKFHSEEIKEIKAKITSINTDFYSISGYASLVGLKVDTSEAKKLGHACSKLSRESNYATGKAYDAKYGQINTYHKDILKILFKL
jgi:hypothetical protein